MLPRPSLSFFVSSEFCGSYCIYILISFLNYKAFEIDFLSISSMTIRRLSFPLKKAKGIWQARTTKNIDLKTVDSQGHDDSSEHSLLKLCKIVLVSSFPRLLPNVYRLIMDKVAYRKVTSIDAYPKHYVHCMFVLTANSEYIGNKFYWQLKLTRMTLTLLSNFKLLHLGS